ncbi:hypothetical protein [Mycoplasma bradburyae]|uniref:Lipoprotein n=1 Tax=Mycoplasma bradburyae TaxID=2963128 RepID=A0AAW6HMW7_9MOLU|nr:hypothetical protein [Mycoplasma bradburyae]MDC4183049.1 hypothetical protein [Mycoplasma bradburyae]UTS70713.1 hypothetical protein NMG77_03090 [Mycoplasma bradburyae]
MKKKYLSIPTLVLASSMALSSCSTAIFKRNNQTYSKFTEILKDPQNPDTSAKQVVYMSWKQNDIRQAAAALDAKKNNTQQPYQNFFSYAYGDYGTNNTPMLNNDADLLFRLFYEQTFISVLGSIVIPSIQYSSNLSNYLEHNKKEDWTSKLFGVETDKIASQKAFYQAFSNTLLTGNQENNYIFTPIDFKFHFEKLTPQLVSDNKIYDVRAYNNKYKLNATEIQDANIFKTSNYLTKLYAIKDINITFGFYSVGLDNTVAPDRSAYITSKEDARFTALANKFNEVYKNKLEAPVFNLKLKDLGLIVRYNIVKKTTSSNNESNNATASSNTTTVNPTDYLIQPSSIDSIIPLSLLSSNDLVYKSGDLKDQKVGFKKEWTDKLVDLTKILSPEEYNDNTKNTNNFVNQSNNIKAATGSFFNLISKTHFNVIDQDYVIDNNYLGANLFNYYSWYFDKLSLLDKYTKIDLTIPKNDKEILDLSKSKENSSSDMDNNSSTNNMMNSDMMTDASNDSSVMTDSMNSNQPANDSSSSTPAAM